MQIRTLTHNIHKGVSYYSNRRILSGLREEIRATQADFVFLQEICGGSVGEPHPQQDYLAEAVWSERVYGRNAVHKKGHHGNAILSKFLVEENHNEDISLDRWERRGLLHAVARLPDGGRLHLFCLHLNLLHDDRRKQARQVIQRLQHRLKPDDRSILAGDFNDWRSQLSRELESEAGFKDAALEALGEHPRTYPSFLPILRLDRIFFRNLTLLDFSVLNDMRWRRLSDHLPLTATFAVG
ncbi:MAG: endonuclease/exonuclease/phosphatase family protein [Rhodospirillales bacterium]|nr:endonuclease/exonuclease/phosphatase family protein [Rhodospirillales bacterium]